MRLNVRWFGARGDGKHYDRPPVGRAMWVARVLVWMGFAPVVYFPKGEYEMRPPHERDPATEFQFSVRGQEP